MVRIVAKISKRARVTIPDDVLTRLHLAPGDEIAFVEFDNGHFEVQRVHYTIASLCGIVPALSGRDVDDFEDVIAEAQEDRVYW